MRLAKTPAARSARTILRIGSRDAPPALRAIEARCARYLPLSISLGVLASALEAFGIAMLIPLLSALFEGTATGPLSPFLARMVDRAIALAPGPPLLAVAITIIGVAILKGALNIANTMLMARVDGFAAETLRNAIAQRALDADYAQFTRSTPSRWLTLQDTHSWKVSEAIRTMFTTATAIATVAVFAVVLAASDWRLFALVVVGVALNQLLHSALTVRLKALGTRLGDAAATLGQQMLQIVQAARVIRLFGREQTELAQFAAASRETRHQASQVESAVAVAGPLSELVLSLVILAVLFAATRLGLGLPEIVAFLVLLYRAQAPFVLIAGNAVRLSAMRGVIAEVESALQSEDQRPRPAAPLPDFGQAIRIDGVSFSYPDSDGINALSDVSFEIAPGSIVALVGPSGAGKSTLVDVLGRLFEPARGRICLGPTDISQFDLAAWRSRIAIAGQDLALVSGTIADNIAYGKPGALDSEIAEAARMADADAFIQALPQGYRTWLGPLGAGLSGGQRQRIGLARALLRRPELIILDEATSAVDGLSERTIIALLEQHRLFGRAILISHRPETLRHCDTLVELAGGQVVWSGPIAQSAWLQRELGAADR